MGNPHPTISKPCKIGRKHTHAPSEKLKQQRRDAAIAAHKIEDGKRRKLRDAIRAYWLGEIDRYPIRCLASREELLLIEHARDHRSIVPKDAESGK